MCGEKVIKYSQLEKPGETPEWENMGDMGELQGFASFSIELLVSNQKSKLQPLGMLSLDGMYVLTLTAKMLQLCKINQHRGARGQLRQAQSKTRATTSGFKKS